MATYVLRDGQMVDKATGAPMLTDEERSRPIPTPRVFGDYEGYRSPIDGAWVDGKRARKYDMEKNNCVDANDFIPAGGRKLKNERFARKRGLDHMLPQQ